MKPCATLYFDQVTSDGLALVVFRYKNTRVDALFYKINKTTEGLVLLRSLKSPKRLSSHITHLKMFSLETHS